VALAGTLEQVSQFKPWLDRKSMIGLQTVGIVSFEPCSATPNRSPLPVLGGIDQIEDILHKSAITQLIVLDLSLGSERLRKLTQLCEGAAVRLLALHDINGYFNHTVTTFEDDGLRFIGLREEPLESPSNRFIKRLMDITVALPIVVLVLPFTTLLIWILQRLQSPGPIFFKQTRVGMKGVPFAMYKYRTMQMNHGAEVKQAAKGDSRVFPAGRWMRKLSIDELPQFINVLKGEMSLVGPRPHMPEHEEMWARSLGNYVVRRFIRPGITGWAQVNGFRGEVHTEADIGQRVGADIYYLENWSFSLDCLIILKTIKHCVMPPGSAY
jgi:putative colanic acid biosynthesis UDP-glucose lipid carrier transferase